MLVPSRHQQLSLIKKLEVEPHSTVVNIHAARKASKQLNEDSQLIFPDLRSNLVVLDRARIARHRPLNLKEALIEGSKFNPTVINLSYQYPQPHQ